VHHPRWGEDVAFLNVNDPDTEYGIGDLVAEHPDFALPVLQDTEQEDAFGRCGGRQFYYFVLDGGGQLAFAHYELEIDVDESHRLVDEVDVLLAR